MCNLGVSYLEGIVDLAHRVSVLGELFEVVVERIEF
uniref:Uncharacterized protein n=1 Tax=Arundo donax TaxID=35708 RepID=A0A0A9H2I6_ARUDO